MTEINIRRDRRGIDSGQYAEPAYRHSDPGRPAAGQLQNTQNRYTEAIQTKLGKPIRATEAASNTMLDLDELDEQSLDRYRGRYEALARQSRGGAEISQTD